MRVDREVGLGHAFEGIQRIDLARRLQLLQDRCEEKGIAALVRSELDDVARYLVEEPPQDEEQVHPVVLGDEAAPLRERDGLLVHRIGQDRFGQLAELQPDAACVAFLDVPSFAKIGWLA